MRIATWFACLLLGVLQGPGSSGHDPSKHQIRFVIFRTYEFAQENGLGFNLTYIDPDRATGGGVGFDTAYMRQIYEYGYEKARCGRFWQTSPPNPGTSVLSHGSDRVAQPPSGAQAT